MGRSARSVVSSRALDVRDEVAEAVDHLVAAAQHGATEVSERSRRVGATARDRSAAAALALRGQRPAPPWPWLVAGLAIGVTVGAAAAIVLALRRPKPDPDAEVVADSGAADELIDGF